MVPYAGGEQLGRVEPDDGERGGNAEIANHGTDNNRPIVSVVAPLESHHGKEGQAGNSNADYVRPPPSCLYQ